MRNVNKLACYSCQPLKRILICRNLFENCAAYSRRTVLAFPSQNLYKYIISAYSLLEYVRGMIISLFNKSIQRTNSFANKSLSMIFELQNKNKRYFSYSIIHFYSYLYTITAEVISWMKHLRAYVQRKIFVLRSWIHFKFGRLTWELIYT